MNWCMLQTGWLNDNTRTRQYQNTVTVPECSESTRKQWKYQNTVTVPEHSESTRTQWQYQNTMTVPEHSNSTRTQWRYQNTVKVPEHNDRPLAAPLSLQQPNIWPNKLLYNQPVYFEWNFSLFLRNCKNILSISRPE